MKPCTTHHHACDCRERQFAEIKTALANLVWACTPLASKLPGEFKYSGACAPEKTILETARKLVT